MASITRLPVNTTIKILEASLAPVYLTTPLYVLEIKKDKKRTVKTTVKILRRLLFSGSDIELKLNLKKRASVREKKQMKTSMNKIVHLGIFFFQKNCKMEYIYHSQR
jgi:hypothetical protein